jgi:hypothetical protein
VGLDQVAVLDTLAAGENLAAVEKGLGRMSLLGQRFLVAVLVLYVVVRRQMRPGLLMRDDRRARPPKGQIPAHLIEVPMCVEHSLDPARAR